MYDNESETLIDKIDHFCPWTGTTIAGNNYREFQIFVITVFTHVGVTMIVALIGVFLKAAEMILPSGGGVVGNTTTVAA